MLQASKRSHLIRICTPNSLASSVLVMSSPENFPLTGAGLAAGEPSTAEAPEEEPFVVATSDGAIGVSMKVTFFEMTEIDPNPGREHEALFVNRAVADGIHSVIQHTFVRPVQWRCC